MPTSKSAPVFRPAPAAPAPTTAPNGFGTAQRGTAATVAPLKTIEGVMGEAVRSLSGNEDMGHIVDVLVGDSGEIRAAVIDFGGFLGVGSRKVAVAWKTLDFDGSIQSGSVKVSLTRDQVRQAPEYKSGEPIVILEGTAAATPEPAAAASGGAKSAAPPMPPGHKEDSPAH